MTQYLITQTVNNTLFLEENQRVCPTCEGLGVLEVQREHNLDGENHVYASLEKCNDCTGGVQELCYICKERYKGRYQICIDCPKCEKDDINIFKVYNEVGWKNTTKYTLEQMKDINITLLFIDNTKEYIEFDELPQWMENNQHIVKEQPTLMIYGAPYESLSLDAVSYLDDMSELLDIPFEYKQEDIQELQQHMDAFVEKYKEKTRTPYPNYMIGLDIEDYFRTHQS